MLLPNWLKHNLQEEEMNSYNNDPENRSDKTTLSPKEWHNKVDAIRNKRNDVCSCGTVDSNCAVHGSWQ